MEVPLKEEVPLKGEYPLPAGAGAGSSSKREFPRLMSVRPSPCPVGTVLLESVTFQKSEVLMFKNVGSKETATVGGAVGSAVGDAVGGLVGSGIGAIEGGSVN